MNEKDNLINRSGDFENGRLRYGSFYEEYVRPVLAEFFGVTLFVCVGCLSVSTGPAPEPIVIAFAHGLTIALLVIGLGDVSGAHVNPAVTAAALLAGAITPVKAVLYVVAQLLGGICGAGLTRGILSSTEYETIGGGAHNLASGVTAGQGMLCEIVLTVVLVLTILMAAVDPKHKSVLAPLAIGFAVVVDILAGIGITGASMNPARSFGPAVMMSHFTSKFWDYHYIYWVGPFGGAIVAGVWYRLFLASSEKRLFLKD